MNYSSDELLALTTLQLIDEELARRDFASFCSYVDRGYVAAPFHQKIMALLQAVFDGRERFVEISIPTRHGKSELMSVKFPAWYLGCRPHHELLHISYANSLSNEFSRRVRAIIRDNSRYRRLFPRVALDSERQRLDDWRTTAGGGFRSVGIQSGIAGRGADGLLLDDPQAEESARSMTQMENDYQWYAGEARTRLHPGAWIVLAMTRRHQLDLPGRLLDLAQNESKADQWTKLVLPGLALEADPMGRRPGEALWPERYDEQALAALRAVSESKFQALIQQDPRGTEVKMFNIGSFREFHTRKPVMTSRPAWCFDLAITDDDRSDYTAWARVQHNMHSGAMLFTDMLHVREEWPQVKRWILGLMLKHDQDDFVFDHRTYELMAVQQLREEFPEMDARIHTVKMVGDKRARAAVFADVVEAGLAWVEHNPDLGRATNLFMREHDLFDGAPHDDFVDVSSVATHWFGLHKRFEMLIGGKPKKPVSRLVAQVLEAMP